MIAVMVVCAFLAVVITLVNLSVILVYVNNRNLLHSQGVYKVSLAFADILVGIVVLPTFISTLLRTTTGRELHSDFGDVVGYQIIDGNLSNNSTTVQVRVPGGRFSDFFDQTYVNAVGFFTFLSLSVSIYSLMIAGFDRLMAVYRPLSYRKDKAKSLAKILCLVLWGIGIVFAIIPTFVPTLNYGVVATLLVAWGGQSALILYVVAFAIPMILMLAVNIATLLWTKKHARARRHLTIDSKRKTNSIEIRLTRTLSIMAGAFTLSVLPVVLVLLSSLFARSIYYTNPRDFDLESAIVYDTFEFVSIIILVCNSLWNFFIYSARNLEFRKAVKNMYRNASQHLRVTKCCTAFQSCARLVVHDSRQRISSISLISNTFTKKSSLFPTNDTNLNSKTKASSSADETSQAKNSKATSSETSSIHVKRIDFKSSRPDSTNDVSVTSLAVSSKTEGKRKKSKDRDNKVATDDSTLQSFAIEANADRLCLSVMEQIDQEIREVAGAATHSEQNV